MKVTSCPLCKNAKLSKSWLTVVFEEINFSYLECLRCCSLICNPMPANETLLKMYNPQYFKLDECANESSSVEKFNDVLNFLKGLERGTFIDYGCGEGKLLKEAAKLGWKVLGVDFNPELAESLVGTDIEVLSHHDIVHQKADVLHLGDVLEHITDLETQMPEILKLLKCNGYLVAQGPLEANNNFFNWMLKLQKQIRRTQAVSIPPYHVILATSPGQRYFFSRYGLSEILFRVEEVAFPAPSRISLGQLTSLRTTSLYMIRKISQLISRINIEKFGNRYFYVGKKG